MIVEGESAARPWVAVVLGDPAAAAVNAPVIADALEDSSEVGEWMRNHPDWGRIDALRVQPGRWHLERWLLHGHGANWRCNRLVYRNDRLQFLALAVVPEARCAEANLHQTTVGDLNGHERLHHQPGRGWLCPACLAGLNQPPPMSPREEAIERDRQAGEFIRQAAEVRMVPPENDYQRAVRVAREATEAEAARLAGRQVGDFDDATTTVYLGNGRSVALRTLRQAGLQPADIAGMGHAAYDTLVRMGLLRREGGR